MNPGGMDDGEDEMDGMDEMNGMDEDGDRRAAGAGRPAEAGEQQEPVGHRKQESSRSRWPGGSRN